MSDQCLLTLTISPTLEESLVDWLLDRGGHTGFTSFPVSGHSSRQEDLSLSEQVVGRRRQIRFEVKMAQAEMPAFLDDLHRAFRGIDLRYWVVPVIAAGHL